MTKYEMQGPLEAVKRVESETVRRAREVFRKSMLVGYEPVLGRDEFSKFEHWFISRSVRSFDLKLRTKFLADSSLIVLNYTSNLTLLDLYSSSVETWCSYRVGVEERKRERIMRNLMTRVGEAELTIHEYPMELEKIRRVNESIKSFADRTVKPAVEQVFGSAGAATGLVIMMVGLTSGAIGYVVGKTVRTSGEALVSKLAGGKK